MFRTSIGDTCGILLCDELKLESFDFRNLYFGIVCRMSWFMYWLETLVLVQLNWLFSEALHIPRTTFSKNFPTKEVLIFR